MESSVQKSLVTDVSVCYDGLGNSSTSAIDTQSDVLRVPACISACMHASECNSQLSQKAIVSQVTSSMQNWYLHF